MSEPYMPTTEQVRNNMALGVALSAVATRDGIPELAEAARDVDWPYPGFRERAKGQFDRWLAEHDRQVAERAWGEGLDAQKDYAWRCEDSDAAGQGVWVRRPENPYRGETA